MDEVLRSSAGVSWTGLTNRTNIISLSNIGESKKLRKVTRDTTQRWRAVAQVGEPNVARRQGNLREAKVVVMVDPVEAKRLAAIEMKAIEARRKLKKQREIEAINGGWAVIGLTAGICCEGYTGKSIIIQIAGYLDGLADFFVTDNPFMRIKVTSSFESQLGNALAGHGSC